MSLTTYLEPLLVYDPSYARTTVNVWVAETTAAEMAVLGRLFMISLIESPDKINQEVINIIQSEVKKNYYHNATWAAERSLESTLEQTNQRLHHLINEGVNQWLPRAHILIGALHNHQLVLAPAGGINCYLLRGSRLHDIVGPPGGAIQPLRIFSQLVVGRIEAGDRLLFFTPSLLDYFSLEKLRRTVTDHQPDEAVRIIESTLLGADPEHAFAALIISSEAATESPSLPAAALMTPAHDAPRMSMEQLIARQQQTEKFLAPSLWPTIRQAASSASRYLQFFWRQVVLRRPPKRMLPPLITAPVQPSSPPPGQNKWLDRSRSIVLRLRYFFSRLGPVNRTPTPSRMTWPAARFGTPLERLVLWFQNLPRRQRTVVVFGLALLLVLSISIIQTAGPKQNNQAALDKISTITERLNSAEAALLYGGDESAAEAIASAETLIAQLPSRRSEDQARRQTLSDRLQKLIDQTSKQTVINEPAAVANFSANLPNFQPRQIYLLSRQLLAVDPTANTVATTPLTDNGTSTVIPALVDIGDLQTGVVTGTNTVMFATDRSSFAELDVIKKTWKPYDASWPVKQPIVQFVSFFQNRVYVLDPDHQEIYRFAKGASSLGLGGAWLKEPIDLSAARAAVVDGSIYILQPKGTIQQFVSGRLSDWRLAAIRPSLAEATRLWTDRDSTYLYLLDPSQRRLVVYDKDGQLVDQYTSPVWTGLRDVVADERAKQAYILNGSTIYRISLKH